MPRRVDEHHATARGALILGALVASWILPQLGVVLAPGTLGQIIDATIGGVIILVILALVRRS